MVIQRIRTFWKELAGSYPEFDNDNIAVNVACIITITLLWLWCIENVFLKLFQSAGLLLLFSVIFCFLFYLSRVKRKYYTALTIYAIVTYLALIGNYLFNAGINGPTIVGFFLSFFLLMAVAQRRYHLLIGLLHAALLTVLFIIEEYKPSVVAVQYSSIFEKTTDWIVSYIVGLVFTYIIINFLQKNYQREKIVVDKQNEELQELMLEKDKILSLLAHDIRSPLVVIQGYLDLMSTNSLDKEQEDEVKHDLSHLTNRTLDMLSNLLNWSKNQMGGIYIELQEIDINEVLKEKIKLYQALADKKEITITYTEAPGTIVSADREMIKAVLRNLISNAIKFTHRKGEINISVLKNSSTCDIAIQDNGIGISKEMGDKLFTLRATSTYGTGNEKGIGLGLTLVKEFMELQHGSIAYKSTPGSGSTFIVSLPLKNVMISYAV